ncbi:MAG TPA: aspartate carbamoyltransferase regulatory subunit [Candidatus Ozemobacteraceae bacterium]|nr:aspartate carbamoyltransferase regulatory subunit [Candidatus Ozemobacteraceae bacterium]
MTSANVLLIPKIENGIVIDHIPAGLGSEILHILSYHPELAGTPITFGLNYQSRRLGKKDLIKLQITELPPRFLSHLSIIAPGVTVKRIKDFKVDRKIILDPPEIIEGILKCPNPNCVTNFECHVRTSFHCLETSPLRFRCNFCERLFAVDELEPTLQPREPA